MNEDVFKGQWLQIKGRIKNNWGMLTDNEIDQIDGRVDMLIGKLQEKYGYSRVDAQREVDQFLMEVETRR